MLSATLLVGNLAADPEFKQAGQNRVAKLRVITDESWLDRASGERKKKATPHFVEIWKAGVIDALEQNNLRKGDAIIIYGIIQQGRYEEEGVTKYTHTIAVKDFNHFAGSNLFVGRDA